VDEQEIAFQGEMMLLQWNESSTRGRTVTFLVDGETDSHPFRDFTIKSGKRAGQRFMAVLVQIDDDEQPVKQQPKRSQRAAVLCKDPDFWHWASERSFARVNNEDTARRWILDLMSLTSRSQIDQDEMTQSKFDLMIDKPFYQYQQSRVGL
jgi:hypothetical protein